MTGLVRSFKINSVSHEVQDPSALPALNTAQENTLLSTGTYRGENIEAGTLFAAKDGIVKRYAIVHGPAEDVENINFASTGHTPAHDMRAVAWDGEKFVGIDAQTGAVAWTTDGYTWTEKGQSPLQGISVKMLYVDGTFYAWDDYSMYTSTDGINFDYFEMNVSFYSYDLFHCKDYWFVRDNNDKTKFKYSTDLKNWSQVGPEGKTSVSLYGVAYVNGNYVFAGEDDSGCVNASTMTGWTSFSFTQHYEWDPYCNAVIEGKGGSYAIGFFGNEGPMKTTDGHTWSPLSNLWVQWPMCYGSTIDGVCYVLDSSYLWVSKDGTNWDNYEADGGLMTSVTGTGDIKVLFPGYDVYTEAYTLTYDTIGGSTYRTLEPLAYTKSEMDFALERKQGKLTAGEGITIDGNNTIRASGGIPSYNEGTISWS